MDRISKLPDELLVKILSFASTNLAVSTSILSKRWEFLWKSVPKLDCDCLKPPLRDFINKNLPLRAPIIETLCLEFCQESFQLEDIKLWIGVAVSRCLCELSIKYPSHLDKPDVLVPKSLYTCKSLVTLKLEGSILVDVPRDVCLPSLKTLLLRYVIYANQDSLRLLLSYCPVLEDLVIERGYKDDKVKAIVVILPSLHRFSLEIDSYCSYDRYVIVTPSLKYFKLEDERENFSALIENMPKLEEADIDVMQSVEKLLESVTFVKRLTLRVMINSEEESVYRAGMVFNQLEILKICICNDYWSVLIVWLLKKSPKLRVLNLYVDTDPLFMEYESDYWKNIQRYVPECLKSSLETLEFKGYSGRAEERDFLSFIFKNARCLKTSSITHTIET